jgi:1-acyl-sn-glycerol-3-phosphate acyltransferase
MEAQKQERVREDGLTYLVQRTLGLLCQVFLCFPYERETRGLDELPRRRYLFASNHVSLLDTLLLGGILWRTGRMPFLVLGDRSVWSAGWIRRALASRIGFLIEREHPTRDRIRQLQSFGRSIEDFQLLVFPEGTRGDGLTVKECQAGIYFVAQAARAPVVPIFIEGMQHVSTKTTPFHPLGGLRKVRVRFGAPWPVEEYSALDADAFRSELRLRIQALGPRT